MEGVTQLYFWNVFPHFGVPSKIITDQDPQFTSQFMKELCAQLQIEQNTSTAYHPWMDGQSEWTNQWLEQYLCFWVNHHQDDWYHFLPLAEFTHNLWWNKTTKTTPYQMLMGYNPVADWKPIDTTVPALISPIEQLEMARHTLYAQMKCTQERWVQAKQQCTFREGDLVWLERWNLHMDQPSAKLTTKWYGPFPVAQVLSSVTYQLTLPALWKIHPMFHVDLLTPYKETAFHSPNYMRPPRTWLMTRKNMKWKKF